MTEERRPAPELVGMVHLAGWPHDAGGEATMKAVVEHASIDTGILVDAGFHSIMIQNLGSRSSWRAETHHEVACLSMLLTSLRHAHPQVRFGLNLPSDDPRATLAVAYGTGATFVRIKVWVGVMRRLEGTLDGCAYDALQYRHLLRAGEIEIWADVMDRTGDAVWPLDFGRAVEEATFTGLQTLVVTAPDHRDLLVRLRTARHVAPDLRLMVGGGGDAGNVVELLTLADGVIVGSSLRGDGDGGRLAPERARSFLAAAARRSGGVAPGAGMPAGPART
jgi:membrane complex biogenesis BtpA family protein